MSTGGGGFLGPIGVSGLSASTAYTAYFVAESGGGELQPAPTAVDFTTAAPPPPDATPPVFTAGPTITSGPTHNSAGISLTLNESGFYYLIAVPVASTAPTSAEVKAGATTGTPYSGVTPKMGQFEYVVGSSAADFSLMPLLDRSTAYKVYVIGEDGAGNLMTTPVGLDVTTTAAPPDTTPPIFTAGPTITSGPTHNSAGISLTLNESGLYYLIAVPVASAAPTSAEVKAGATTGTPYSGVTPKMGQYNYVTGGVAAVFALMPVLDSSTAYKVYVIGEDGAGNLTTTPVGLDVTTTAAPPDTTPPVLTAGPTITSGPTSSFAAYSVTYDEPGHIYSIVVPAAAAAPTAAQVKAMVNYGAVTIGTHFDTTMQGNTARTMFASFSIPSTTYKVYFVAEDSAGNLQAAPSSLNVTTASAFAVTTISPDTGPSSGGTSVTITGSDFVNGATVTIGGTAATGVSWVSATSITATTPAGTAGAQNVVVTNPDTQSRTLTSGFTFASTPPYFLQQGPKLVGAGAVGASGQGYSVSVSADGNTAIVGASGDNNNMGAAWVYTRSAGVWSQQGAKLVGTGAIGQSQQGQSVALSADGNTAMVGGYADDNYVGAVWVYTRTAGVWSQQGGKLVGTGASGEAAQGAAVSLSVDGNTAVVGGFADGGNTGAAWFWTRSAGVWSQQGSKLVGTDSTAIAGQGSAVSLSADGNTALVGGYLDNSQAGAAWVYTRSAGVWSQQGSKLVGSGAVGNALQGIAVSLSGDGNTAIVGGSGDSTQAGAAWVYTRSAGMWYQQGNKLVGAGATGPARRGVSVSLTSDGNMAMIGGSGDNSNTGAAWVYQRLGEVFWFQQGSKLVGTGAAGGLNAFQGSSVSLSGDGSTAMVGGYVDNNSVGAAWAWTLAAPTVTSVSPASGTTLGSTSVTITGSGFANGATATIGGTAATNVSWVSATSITATTPAGTVGAKDVVVTNPDTQSGTLASGFTYVTAITVTSISPSSGPTGGGTPVTITGTAFVNGATVTIGGAAATNVNWVNSASITATTPAGTVGAADVVVTNPDTQSATLGSGFMYVAGPAVTAISPSSGPTGGGTSVTITGSGFINGATVTIGGAAASSVSWVSVTSITATIPAGMVGARDVVVTNLDSQSGTLTNGFTYVGTPGVSLNPTSLAFANQVVGTTSAARNVTLTNTGNAALTISGITSNNGVFGVTHDCGGGLAAGASCTLGVTFSPAAAVSTSSSISVSSNAAGSPHAVAVNGTGIPGGAPVCTLTANPTTVAPNGTAVLTSNCTNTPTSYSWTGGTCAGTTAATCTVTPAVTTTYSVTGTNAAGPGTGSATVTVSTGKVDDFNGDNKSDILWQQNSTGYAYLSLMNVATTSSTTFVGGGSGWTAVGNGDFNGDGKADILWQQNSTGFVYMWLMNGATVSSTAYVGGGAGWSVVGIGDLNGDGKSDILWQQTSTGYVYMTVMNGGVTSSSYYVGGGAGWSVVGVRDFNGDGKTDIVWQQTSTGYAYMSLMNGPTASSTTYVGGGAGWIVAGTGDFNGDGKADILWQQNSTGYVYMSLMNGATTSSTTYAGGGTGWSVVATGDYNGDGKSDILWQQTSTGNVYMWLMNGSTYTLSAYIGGGTGWSVRSRPQ